MSPSLIKLGMMPHAIAELDTMLLTPADKLYSLLLNKFLEIKIKTYLLFGK
jgi:hypothetical protein